VNFFRRDAAGGYAWPGFGENVRVLRWVLERCAAVERDGGVGCGALGSSAADSPIGLVPAAGAIDVEGLPEAVRAGLPRLCAVDAPALLADARKSGEFLKSLGWARLPQALKDAFAERIVRLEAAAGPPPAGGAAPAALKGGSPSLSGASPTTTRAAAPGARAAAQARSAAGGRSAPAPARA